MNITVTIQGSKQLITKLQNVENKLKDFTVEFVEVGEFEKKWFANFPFVSQGGIFGQAWPRLSTAYQVEKAKRFPGRPMLVRTGAMKNSFNFNSTKDFVRIFNDSPYYQYHQTGTSRMPKRVIMQIEDTQKRAIMDIIEKSIRRKIDGAI